MVEELTFDTFEERVLQSDLPYIVDFYGDWCPPCNELEPVLEAVSETFAGKIRFGKVNTTTEKKLRIKYYIASIPFLVLFKDGKRIPIADGYMPQDKLEAQILEGMDRFDELAAKFRQ